MGQRNLKYILIQRNYVFILKTKNYATHPGTGIVGTVTPSHCLQVTEPQVPFSAVCEPDGHFPDDLKVQFIIMPPHGLFWYK